MAAVAHWPLTFSRDTPRFASDHAGFDAFFDDVDELGNRTTASDQDRILWACRYAGAESESWRTLPAFKSATATFAMFRDQVRAYYPHLDANQRFMFRDLDVLAQHTQSYSNMTREDYGRYLRSFVAISSYLKTHHDLSNRECGLRFLDGFPQPIRTSIAGRLLITRSDIIPSNGYPLADIQEAASFVFAAGGADYQSPVIAPPSSAVSTSDPTSIKDLIQVLSSTITQSVAAALQQQPQPPSSNIKSALRTYGHSREGASMHFLEVSNEHGFTRSALTPNGYHGQSEPPTTSPEIQKRNQCLETQIELLRRSSKRVSPPPQYRRVPNKVPSSRPQPSLPTIYSRPVRPVDEAPAQRPRYPMVPIPVSSGSSDEYEFRCPAVDASQMPEPTHDAFDVPPEYGDEFRRYRDTPSDEPAVNFRQ